MTSSSNGARGRSRSPMQHAESQLLSPMRPVAHSNAMPEDSQLLSPVRPVAHSGTMQSTTGVGSPEPRVRRVQSRSGSPERPGIYYSPMRPVAHDNPIPTNTMVINIKTQTGKTIKLEVEESDTIASVKDSLQWCYDVDARDKKLMKGWPDAANMGQLGIQPGDTLHLVDTASSGRTIYVKTPTGKTITVDVDVSDKIEDVKRKIRSCMGWMEGVDSMVLSLHLEDGKNFCDYIIPGSVYVVYMLPAYAMPRTPP